MIMIDYSNCDMTIDELSAQSNVSKEELITDIAKKYNKSVIEVNNWIKIGKGNIKVAIDILNGLGKFKRIDDADLKVVEDKNSPEAKVCNCDKYHTLMDKNKKESMRYGLYTNNILDKNEGIVYTINDKNNIHKIMKDAMRPPYDCVKLDRSVFRELKVDDIIAYFMYDKWNYFRLDVQSLKTGMIPVIYNDKCLKVIDILDNVTIPIFAIKSFDFEITEKIKADIKFDNNTKKLLDSNLLNKIEGKQYSIEKKGSATYIKTDNDVLGPFNKCVVETYNKQMYEEIASIIGKYPNFLEIIAVLLNNDDFWNDRFNSITTGFGQKSLLIGETNKKESIRNLIKILENKLHSEENEISCNSVESDNTHYYQEVINLMTSLKNMNDNISALLEKMANK